MDDFRKPYEYMDEKRWVVINIFIIMLVVIDILQAPLYIIPVYRDVKQFPILPMFIMIVGILYVLFILYTAITCYRVRTYMVKVTKVYLVVRAVITVSCIIILYVYGYREKSQIDNLVQFVIIGLVLPLAFELTFSIGWYLYFSKSKKCRELMKTQNETI